jgi:hypothetical protein
MVCSLIASILFILLPLWEYRSSFVDVFTGASRRMPLIEIVPTSGQDSCKAADLEDSSLLRDNDVDRMELSLLSELDANSNNGIENLPKASAVASQSR